jgi:hypothetical protein
MPTFIFYFLFFAQSDWGAAPRRFGKGCDWFIIKETHSIPQIPSFAAKHPPFSSGPLSI